MAMAANLSDEELRLLVKVSRYYYEDGLNQDAITARMGLSRSKVSRLMAQAREVGVVQISVATTTQAASMYPAKALAMYESAISAAMAESVISTLCASLVPAKGMITMLNASAPKIAPTVLAA